MSRSLFFGTLAGLLILLTGCIRPWPGPSQSAPILPEPTSTVPLPVLTSTAPPPTPLPSSTPKPLLKIWIDPLLPANLLQRLVETGQVTAADEKAADVRLMVGQGGQSMGRWVLALAAPFPTLVDSASLSDLKAAWQGAPPASWKGRSLILAPATRAALERSWGPARSSLVRSVPADQLADIAWREKTSWAILPFEVLQPRWKVIRLDGHSPYDRSFDPGAYGLTLPVSVVGDNPALDRVKPILAVINQAPLTNRDPQRLTVVVMTGVTGLARGTAYFMEKNGLEYPGKDIRDWLRDADFTHVSSEVSFDTQCPYPNPNDPNLRFCSDPKYIKLLQDVGVNVVEMTGNHLADFGNEWVNYTIDLYKKQKWLYFGAGANQEQARKAVTVEHNGNRIAFIGCNPAGPKADWATQDKAGTADCDYPEMTYFEDEVKRLTQAGYLVIATFQYYESYEPVPLPIHYRDFRRISDAGAVIVSGSQAHLPQAMELRGNRFIHYGLGNLFFDQMDTPWPDTKNEFIDRHVFYDGRYLGVDLYTAQLEDFVKPRPMTAAERQVELTKIFEVSGWPPTGKGEWRIFP